jgi:hypothetical protein
MKRRFAKPAPEVVVDGGRIFQPENEDVLHDEASVHEEQELESIL